MRTTALALVLPLLLAACGDEIERSACKTTSLPLQGIETAPKLTSVRLECQEGKFLNLHATAIDGQGHTDLMNVQQSFELFDSPSCTAARWSVNDDFVTSGIEESFGSVLIRSRDPDLFDQVCRSASWPVRARLRDVAGNRTEGVVDAMVTQS